MSPFFRPGSSDSKFNPYSKSQQCEKTCTWLVAGLAGAWGNGGVRTAGQHQAGAAASSRGEVAHPGLPRQEQSRLEDIVKLRF